MDIIVIDHKPDIENTDVMSNKVKHEVQSSYIFAILLVIFIGTFHIVTIREGYGWRSDSSLYIAHAKNIALHRDYNNTGFIYNPDYPSYSPKVYPPVFPILLSPLYKVFGLNIKIMKLEGSILFICTLLIITFLFKKKFPDWQLYILIIIIGIQPFFWFLKEEVLSDIPFMLLFYIFIVFVQKTEQDTNVINNKMRYFSFFILGSIMYLAYATRTLGIVFIPCFFIHFIVNRKIYILSLFSLVVFSLFLILQIMLIGRDNSYIDQLYISHTSVAGNIAFYLQEYKNLFGEREITRNILSVIVGVFAIVGYASVLKEKGILELIVLVYIIVILLWPANQGRFIAPLIPCVFLYLFTSINLLHRIFKNKFIERYYLVNATIIIISLVILSSYIETLSILDLKNVNRINTEEGIELFDYIKNNTNINDIIISRDPRTIVLFTNRRASVYRASKSYEDLWKYIQLIDAKYIVVGGYQDDTGFSSDQKYLNPFIRKHRKNFERVFANSNFKLYKIINYYQ